MDTFVEQIIVKKKGPKEIAIITGTILLVVILVFVLFLFLNYFSLVIDMLLIYGAWWLITGQNVEYEYSVTNGDIDIDQIIAQRKRKRVVSVAGSKIETAGPYNPTEFAGTGGNGAGGVVLHLPQQEKRQHSGAVPAGGAGHGRVQSLPAQAADAGGQPEAYAAIDGRYGWGGPQRPLGGPGPRPFFIGGWKAAACIRARGQGAARISGYTPADGKDG